MHKGNYFVRHLPLSDPRRAKGYIYQIQSVDRYGRAIGIGYASNDATEVIVDGVSVPLSVIESVKRMAAGESQFVDASGLVLQPKDLLK